MSNNARIVVAVIVGLILLGGIVSCIFVQDETTILMTVLLAVVYAFYLVKLRQKLKQSKTTKNKAVSPLMRRR